MEVAQVAVEPPPLPTAVLAGRVVDGTTQAPVERARVVLSADPAVLPDNRVAITDVSGSFRFPQLPATDTYELRVSKTGFATQWYGEAPPDYVTTKIALAQDEVEEQLVVAIVPEVWIEGRINDEDGTPLSGALVEASRAVFADGVRTLVSTADAMTDDRGDFRLSGLVPGQYYLSTRDPAFVGVADATGPLRYPDTFFPGVVEPGDAERLALDSGRPLAPVSLTLIIGRPQRVTRLPNRRPRQRAQSPDRLHSGHAGSGRAGPGHSGVG